MLYMDLDSIEGLNEVRPAVYRAALKLLSLQKMCYMHVVSLKPVQASLRSVGGVWDQEAGLGEEEVMQLLNRMFHSVSQEAVGQVTLQAPEHTCRLIYQLYDRSHSGFVSGRSVEVCLIALSADTLSAKYRALVCVAERNSRRGRGVVSRSSLRGVLQDLSQIPAAVEEHSVFGCVETAMRTCFSGVLTPSVGEDHVLSWLQSEPRLLLWLPTLYRLSVSQNVTHVVRCHACKTYPITGLRYRCMKCVNVHLCQSCFLTDRQTRKHKTTHPVLEHCTQPSWRESLASFAHSTRHALLPRRYTRREAERRRGLMRGAESQESQARALSPDSSPPLVASPVRHSSSISPRFRRAPLPPDTPPSTSSSPPPPSGASPRCSSPPRLQCKSQQTEDVKEKRDSALLKDVRHLQRDRWLLEEELKVWRVTVQSEQGILEDRCSEMEVTMETLRRHNLQLQGMITRTLSRTETGENMTTHNGEEETTTAQPSGEEENTTAASQPSGEEEQEEEDEEMKRREEEYRERLREEEEEEDSELAFLKDEAEAEEEHDGEEDTKPEEQEEEEGQNGSEFGSDTETHSPTIPREGTSLQPCQSEEEGPVGDGHLSPPMAAHCLSIEERLRTKKHLISPMGEEYFREEEDCGTCSPVEADQQLWEMVASLKATLALQKDTQTGSRSQTDLLMAAEHIGDSLHHLVAALSSHTHYTQTH